MLMLDRRGLLVMFICRVTPNTSEREYTESSALFYVRTQNYKRNDGGT